MTNEYLALLRSQVSEAKLRGDDFVIAPYENAVAELDDILLRLDADTGESVMLELRKMILNEELIPARNVAHVIESVVKDLLRVKHRLETSNANYRKKRQAQARTQDGGANGDG